MPLFGQSFEDCRTVEEAKAYFREFAHERPSGPATDATLALRKLRASNPFLRNSPELWLRPDQSTQLESIVTHQPDSWDEYCDVLSLKQILCVGW